MHNIEKRQYPENCDKRKVAQELQDYAEYETRGEGGSGLTNPIRWLGDTVYGSWDEADEAIRKLDRGWYDNLAVKFKKPLPFKTDKLDELRQIRNETAAEYVERNKKVYPKTLASAYLGCKKCGSKLAIKYLSDNWCPVCKADLRPEYMLKSIEAAKTKADRAKAKMDEYIQKHAKSEVCWLVKIEYHT